MGYIGNQSTGITYTNINTFRGKVANLAALSAVSGMMSGYLYITEDNNHAHMYTGTAWVDLGEITGPAGPIGPQGIAGASVSTVVRTTGNGSAGTTDVYTITYSDATTSTFNVYNGKNGVNGANGVPGKIDHITRTVGTGAAGTTDTYTAYADVAETQLLGTFDVYNGYDGVASTVGSLVDVDLTTVPVEDGQTIVWNEVEGKWLPGDSNSAVINKPVITSPVNLTVGYIGAVTSTYSTGLFYGGLQTGAIWECALDYDFNNIIDSYEGNNNLTSWTPSVGLALTQVFIRTKQISDGHRSEFSDVISFTTPDTYIQAPTMTIGGNLSGLVLTPTISLSAFSVFNGSDTHISTDYQVVNKTTGVVKWESLGNTVDKLGITTGQLDIQTGYTFRARFNGKTYGNSSWVELDGTTINIYVENPILTVAGIPVSVTLSPTMSGSVFNVINGVATHISTDYRVVKVSDNSVVFESLNNTSDKTSIQITGLEKTTAYKFMIRYNSDSYGSSSWVEVNGTTLDIYVVTPTLTVSGHPLDIGKNPILTTSAFTIYNGSDTHLSADYQILKNSDGSLVWESLGNTLDKLTINSGDLVESVEYRFRARHNSTNYGSSAWVEVIGTTKSQFTQAYGLTWNNINDMYTRTGITISDFSTDTISVQRLMRRCVLNVNGTVNYYLSATDSTKREDGITASDLTGASGNVMVEIPKFYCKYDDTPGAKNMSISLIPEAGYVVHPAFVKNGVEVDYRYYRAYKGSVSGGKLISRSGVAAAGNETIAAFRTKAKSNGTGWGLVDWNLLFAVQTLCFIEIGTFNSQSILGNGNDTGSDYGMTTGGSNSIGNASSPSTNDDTWMSYRGIENFYADIFEWIDGINISERLVYTSNTQSTFASDVFTGAYISTGKTLPSSGHIKDMSFSIKGFIPINSVGGSDSTYVTDYVYSDAGARVAAFGGYASSGLVCGAACLYANCVSSYAFAFVGAGLSF